MTGPRRHAPSATQIRALIAMFSGGGAWWGACSDLFVAPSKFDEARATEEIGTNTINALDRMGLVTPSRGGYELTPQGSIIASMALKIERDLSNACRQGCVQSMRPLYWKHR